MVTTATWSLPYSSAVRSICRLGRLAARRPGIHVGPRAKYRISGLRPILSGHSAVACALRHDHSMARYDDQRVPRGTSRRWEVILADDERPSQAPRLRAIDLRAQHRILQLLTDDELRQISLMGDGEQLGRY